MNAKQLFLRTSKRTRRFKPTKAWYCTECRCVAATKSAAEQCCDYRCNECGVKTPKYILQCDACRKKASIAREQARFDKAKHYTVKDCPADVALYDDNETWYHDLDHAMSDLGEDLNKGEERVLWLCEKRTPHIDEDVFEHGRLSEMWELHEDADPEDFCEGLDELRAAVDAFNAKQKPTMSFPTYAACVVITYEDLGIEEEEAA